VVIETILFDLDDTLVAETEWARGGWAVVAEHLARGGHDAAELRQMMSRFFDRDRRHVFDQLADALGLDAESVRDCITLYRHSRRPLTVLPDGAAALEFAAGRRRGIVTDGAYETQRTKVECARLEALVEVIVYTDRLGPGAGKPSPAGFLDALRQLGMPPDSAIYVADNAGKDFAGPRGLGMRTIQVTRPDGVYAGVLPPQDGEPDAVVDSLFELGPLLQAWERESTDRAG
jgi:FMN phosphatase YigB (HAD superfamily)